MFAHVCDMKTFDKGRKQFILHVLHSTITVINYYIIIIVISIHCSLFARGPAETTAFYTIALSASVNGALADSIRILPRQLLLSKSNDTAMLSGTSKQLDASTKHRYRGYSSQL